MKDFLEVQAVSRESGGRREARRLRAQGMVPVVVYGASKEPEMVGVEHKELLRHLEHEAFFSNILSLKVDGKAQNVVLREVQRHPSRPQILHMDLLRIAEDRKLVMSVPLHLIGEEACVGVKQQGGVVAHLATEVEISCLPKYLPEYLELDISELEMGSSLHLSDIKLPENVTIPALERSEDLDMAVANVFKPKVVEEEPIEAEAPDEEGAEEATEAATETPEGKAEEDGKSDKAGKSDKSDKADKSDKDKS